MSNSAKVQRWIAVAVLAGYRITNAGIGHQRWVVTGPDGIDWDFTYQTERKAARAVCVRLGTL